MFFVSSDNQFCFKCALSSSHAIYFKPSNLLSENIVIITMIILIIIYLHFPIKRSLR